MRWCGIRNRDQRYHRVGGTDKDIPDTRSGFHTTRPERYLVVGCHWQKKSIVAHARQPPSTTVVREHDNLSRLESESEINLPDKETKAEDEVT
jgi:hypothetical protein